MAVLEISDLVVSWDARTGERVPVRRAEVVARLQAAGDHRAARIVRRMPVRGEYLDPAAVDSLLVRVHTELQRLNEELHMTHRFAELLVPMLAVARASGRRLRVVDIGCGLGFTVRSLAASGVLGADVQLVGVDFNRALVTEATRLAQEERLPCTFVCADAFSLAEEAGVYLSSGVLHHFEAGKLPEFFRAQDRDGTVGFIHYDVAATRLAPLGAWLFHRARMREPLGRHDGVASARRAHGDSVLLSAAAAAAGMKTFLFESFGYTNPFCAAMRPVVGIRPALATEFRRALGHRARRLAAG
ncbi:class I SAM-dependent methyltransferase [Amycolatopsis keratiniphila]|uniref:class I SAM-dependent methyltransferase n=1 Tax=Amycolatopsis keratiniphila TaxID=129921 RepID=UPI00087D9993|nr:methyltransferase domain-containing protein [Amycolatopsis keratiniphila]OLZ52708.1 methyltransferase type 11 [Amycolatopsis keratiniphila subsp. nogabecina]SDU09805.1 Methyltransferase domain-containing protein [Amycolatopsis keratiniphila]